MGKGLQIALMALLYAASAAGGYFVYDMIVPSEDGVSVPVVPEVNHVPVIYSATPERQNNGKYRLTVDASVESGEMLEYQVYADTLQNYVYHSTENIFNDIPSVPSETYYVGVMNTVTSQMSKFIEVKGFKGQAASRKFSKLTASQIEEIVMDYEKAPKALYQSFAPNCSIKLVGVEENDRIKELKHIAAERKMGRWISVKVDEKSISYDDQNRITSITFNVTPKPRETALK